LQICNQPCMSHVAKILSLRHLGVITSTVWVSGDVIHHVTIRSTVGRLVSYRWAIDTKSVSHTVSEISLISGLNLKHLGVMTLTV